MKNKERRNKNITLEIAISIVFLFIISNLTFSQPISGIITVGNQGNYLNITSAISDLKLKGLDGSVTISLLDNNYNPNSEAYPVIIDVQGLSATKTLTLKPAAGVSTIIKWNRDNGSILKITSSYVIIDGSNTVNGTTRNMVIRNLSQNPSTAIVIGSKGTTPVTNVTIKNCEIDNGKTYSDLTKAGIFVGDGTTYPNPGYFSNINISNNFIYNSGAGIYLNGGTSGTANGSSVTVSTNLLNQNIGLGYTGIYATGVNGLNVKSNLIANITASNNFPVSGIIISTNNSNSTIEKNKVNNISDNNSLGSSAITVSTGLTDANVTVKNNLIYGITGKGRDYTASPIQNPYGIVLSGNQTGINLYNNSIYLSGNTLSESNGISAGIFLGTGSSADIRNNAIQNNLGSSTANPFGAAAIFAQSSASQFAYIDNNVYNVNPSGSIAKYISKIGRLGNASTLTAWRNLTSRDKYSLNSDPGFISATDLTPNVNNANSWNLIGKGIQISGNTDDFNGNARSAIVTSGAPGIGAFEFTTTQIPTDAVVTGVIANGNSTDFTYSGFKIATIKWYGTSLPSSVSLKYYTGVNPPNTTPGADVSNYYLQLNTTGGSGYTFDLTINYNPALLGTVSLENDLRPVSYNQGMWSQYNVVPNTGNKTITVMGMSPFSVIAFSDPNSPMPVEINTFTSAVNGNNVKLNWSTVNEVNNSGFEIQRSIAGENNYAKIAFVNGKGNTNTTTDYSFTDRNLNSGKYSYRLKQIDYNGNYEYFKLSSEININVPVKFELSQNYPNPFNPVTSIQYQLAVNSKVVMKVYDMTGREVMTLVNDNQTAGYHTVQLNGSSLSSGVYIYRMIASSNGNEVVISKKMTLLK
jgi:hypothetical protein